MSKELTPIQKKVLDFITERKYKVGITPSLAEIAEHLGIKNRSTVHQHLKSLEKKNFLKRETGLSRSIEVLKEDSFFAKKDILGEVAAGNPLVVYPTAIDNIELPSIVKIPSDSFLLRVKGDSLKDAFIFNGDVVIVNPNIIPVNGHIVIAILEDAAIIKRFYKNEDAIELISENEEYKPIIIHKDNKQFRIVGVVIGIYRNLEKKKLY